MVDGFAEVWPVVALEGVGDLIGDARPGFVAVDGGRRLAFANAAARVLLPEAARGAPLALDERLADRLLRFAARAAPGEETRELLRFAEAGRPILRTVVFRRPIDSDDAVIVHVEGTRLPADVASVEASLSPFAVGGGLAALFDADGGVLGAVGDHTLVEGLEEAIEKILEEADEIAVIERSVLADGRRHDLALVRFGDRPDARRLLWLAPPEASPTASAPITPPAPVPLSTVAEASAPSVAPIAASAAVEVAVEEAASEHVSRSVDDPLFALPAPAFVDLDDADTTVAPTPDEEAAPIPTFTAEVPPTPSSDESVSTAPMPVIDGDGASSTDDLFVAAPPVPHDLFSDFDLADDDLAEAWSTTAAPLTESPTEGPEVVTIATPAEGAAAPFEAEAHAIDAGVSLPPAPEASDSARLPVEAPTSADERREGAPIEGTPAVGAIELAPEHETVPTPAPTLPLPLASVATPLPLAARPVDIFEAADAIETQGPTAVAPIRLPLVSEAEVPAPEAASLESGPAPSLVDEPPLAESPPVVEPADPHVSADGETAAPTGFRFSAPERPVKFVWQMDADHRFTMVSDELASVVGPAAADLVGRSWSQIAEAFDLDRDGTIAGALARRDTWSGRTLLWPIEGEALRIPVDLAALPAFARGRTFSGFRGFGTCRTDAPIPDPAGIGLRLAEGSATPPAFVEPPNPTAPEPSTEEPALACVVEPLAEPPLYPGDCESANTETDHPIEPAFGGDIGDDVLFHPDRQSEGDDATGVEPYFDVTASNAAPEPEPKPEPEPMGDTSAPLALDHTQVAAEAPVPSAVETTEPTATASLPPVETATETPAAPEPVPSRIGGQPSARLVALSGVARLPTEADHLSPPERQAFRQIAEALGARIEGESHAPSPTRPAAGPLATPQPPRTRTAAPILDARLLDRLPLAVALLRDDALIHANERFLTLLRYPDLDTLRAAGGIDALFAGPHVARRFDGEAGRITALIARDGGIVPCEARLATVPIDGGSAAMLTLVERAPPVADAADLDAERIAELQAIVDTATDGVLILDASGLVLSANTAAEALFGVERRDMIGRPLADRLAPESRRSAMDYLDGLASNGVASVLNDGREVIGAVAPEGLIPLFMTIGRVSSGPVAKYCAVLRDITQWKKSEEELTSARRRAEEASIHKSDFLAKISHEIRTPLNAIIGFSELMLDERFGPVGNDRYKDYLRDIHVSGSHIMSLVNDLLDLSKVEAGKMDLRFEAVPLADVVSECVAMMQPQANRDRIIIRSSLPAGVPPVVADQRSMRQVVLNLLSNAIKFTPAGGQVIVSITAEDNGEVILRVRDTGYGMSDKELQTALEPFRQLHTTRSRSGGTGLGLPLTKALTEANRAVFRIDSTVGQGTLVSIAFPVTRVLAS